MRDVLDDLMKWWESGETVAVATVVATFQSAPRPPGASMLVGPDESAVGSVSGGCVEGAVYEVAREVAETGVPVEVFTLGTRLTQITRPLHQRDADRAIVAAGDAIPDLSLIHI